MQINPPMEVILLVMTRQSWMLIGVYDEETTPTNFCLMASQIQRGLASVEEQLVFYKKNEGMLCDQIAVLKRDASFNESKGVGYNDVPLPPTGLFAPPTIDLSNSGLKEFKQPEFEGYGVKVNKSVSESSSNEIKKTSGSPIIKDWVFDYDEDETLEKLQTAVLTKSGLVPISTARQNSSRTAATVSAARPIKTAAPKPFVNVAKIGEQGIDVVQVPKHAGFGDLNFKVLDHVNTGRQIVNTGGFKINTASQENALNCVFLAFVSSDKRCQTHRKIKRGQDIKVPQSGGPPNKGGMRLPKELGDIMEKAVTTASSLEAEQDNGDYTPESDEGSKKLNELKELCIKLFEKEEVEYILKQITLSKEEFLSTVEEIAQKLNEEEMTKAVAREGFDREDLVALWSLVKERFRFAESTEDMEKALWAELKRLFEPDKDDVLWKLQRYMHDSLTWRLYGSCAVQ
ncbi:hypothetical protein Tco_0675402 [Tanacetum coccineum]